MRSWRFGWLIIFITLPLKSPRRGVKCCRHFVTALVSAAPKGLNLLRRSHSDDASVSTHDDAASRRGRASRGGHALHATHDADAVIQCAAHGGRSRSLG